MSTEYEYNARIAHDRAYDAIEALAILAESETMSAEDRRKINQAIALVRPLGLRLATHFPSYE